MSDETTIDPAEFRRIFAHLATGVSVLTAHGADGPVGMAANSVTSVSLDPPLVLVCPAKSSTTWPLIRESNAFCINIMASHHEAVTRAFAARVGDRFAGVGRVEKPTGFALDEALAWIECEIQNEHDAGDHTIVVARAVTMEASAQAASPLVFFRGAYGSFSGVELA
ncbi:Flavin reductase [Baekduia alba]|uniref:flavin reductase family protein n=1 Tax=Baekduia alba TaxID=2997333 RepID=UPI002341D791|nr:flavin reductase family protein [Baekduia alba]WCB93336.1 Flavin reductase [Baekduia alba]